MATTQSFSQMGGQSAIDRTQSDINSYQDKLQSSPTALGGDTPQTPSDLANNLKLTSLQTTLRNLQGQQSKEDWYGKVGATGSASDQPELSTPQNQGLIPHILTDLSKPLYGVVGGIESLTGKGVKPDLLGNINENMQEGHRDVGDLLKSSGLPGAVSAPLGFMGDILLDPVNWATAGTAALVPRVGAGLVRGTAKAGLAEGLTAAGKGAISGLGKNTLEAAQIVDKIPLLNRVMPTLSKTKMFDKLSEKTFKATERYNELTGHNDLAHLGEGIGQNIASVVGARGTQPFGEGVTLGNFIEGQISRLPHGEEIIQKFKYDPYTYNTLVKTQDRVLKMMAKGEPMSRVEANVGEMMKNNPEFSTFHPEGSMSSEQQKLFNNINNGLDDASEFGGQTEHISPMNAIDSSEFAQRLYAEGAADGVFKDDIQRFIRMHSQKTGIDWYDKLSLNTSDWMKSLKTATQDGHDFKKGDSIANVNGKFTKVVDADPSAIGHVTEVNGNKFKYEKGNALTIPLSSIKNNWKDIKVGQTFLETLDFSNKWFKAMKVPLNPAAHVNNVMSSLTMMKMMGIDPTRTMSYVFDAYKFLEGKQNAEWVYNNFVKEAVDFSKFVSVNPTSFKSTMGFAPSQFLGKYFLSKIMQDARLSGAFRTEEELQNMILEEFHKMPDNIRKATEEARDASAAKGPAQQAAKEISMGPLKQETPTELAQRMEKEGGSGAAETSSQIKDLDLTGGAGMDYIKNQALAGNKFYSIVQKVLDESGNKYQRWDQSYKLGTALRATKEGFTAEELTKLSRMIPNGISKADIVGESVSAGQKMYRLSWEKATDVANEAYMNYAAMPAFVRMMRSMPILGAPFVSFTYAMLPKTLKTMYHNPSTFNDIQFLIQSMSGDKTPEEKANLQTKYGNWFQSPGMLRIPFTDSHPAYLNLTNYLPYYSLSMMNPSNRAYKDLLPNTMVNTIDKSQLLKDPMGQVLFDYFILPHLLSEQDRPMSQFGQPLYPLSATPLQKVGYAARSLGEAYTPAIGAIGAGAALTAGLVAPKVVPYVPSYNFRKLGEAIQGNTPLGIPSKTPASELVARGLGNLVGIQENNMNLNFLQAKKKK